MLVASSTLHSFSRCGKVHSHRDWAHKTRSVPREACVMAALTTPGLCKQHSVDSRVRPFHHVLTLLTFRPETGVRRDGGSPVRPLILDNDWIYISLHEAKRSCDAPGVKMSCLLQVMTVLFNHGRKLRCEIGWLSPNTVLFSERADVKQCSNMDSEFCFQV